MGRRLSRKWTRGSLGRYDGGGEGDLDVLEAGALPSDHLDGMRDRSA